MHCIAVAVIILFACLITYGEMTFLFYSLNNVVPAGLDVVLTRLNDDEEHRVVSFDCNVAIKNVLECFFNLSRCNAVVYVFYAKSTHG